MAQECDQEQMDRLVNEFYEVHIASQREHPGDHTASDAFIAAAPEAYRPELHMHFCLEMAGCLSMGYLRYGSDKYLRQLRDGPDYAKFKSELAFLDPDNDFYQLFFIIDDVLRGQADSIMPRLTKCLQAILDNAAEDQDPFKWEEFTTLLVIPLKEGVPGMWTAIGELMQEGGAEKGLTELCFALEKFYYSADDSETVSALQAALQENDSLHPARELLAAVYCDMKLWSNALACFERLEDDGALGQLFYADDDLSSMAWCYEKRREYAQAEIYYRRTLEAWPEKPFALNNLGYSLYRQKKYAEETVGRKTV